MKYLILAFLRVLNHFKTNRAIISIFIVGIFSSVIAFIYFYGNYTTTKVFILESDKMFRTYDITFDSPIYSNNNSILWADKQKYEDIIYHTEPNFNLPTNMISNNKLYTEEIQSLTVKASRSDSYPYGPTIGRANFNKEEKEGKDVIIFPSENWLNIKNIVNTLPRTIKLNDMNYELIGIHNYAFHIVIPYKTFIKNNLPITTLQIVLTETLSTDEDKIFVKEISEIFQEGVVKSPYSIYSDELYLNNEQAKAGLYIFSIIFAVAFISFMFLIKHMFDMSRYENVIYSLVGASRTTVVFMLLLETLLLTLFGTLSAIVFHTIFRVSLFDKINIYPNITYSIEEYMYILFMACFISIICCIPFLVSFWRNSLITLKSKYK